MDRKDVPITEELIRRFDYELRGRERVDGHSVLKVDFTPRDGPLPVNSFMDRFINRTQGTVWVDEDDFEMVRAHFVLREKVNLVGGLLGAVFSLESEMHRARTPEGLWYLRQLRWNVAYRELWTHKVVEFTETREDVQHAP